MVENWTQYLLAPGPLSLRELLRLLLLSGLFTTVCVLAFPRNAPTRRLLLIAAVMALLVLPWLLASVDAVWHMTVQTLPGITLNWPLPQVVLWVWLGVALALTATHAKDVRVELGAINRLPPIHNPELDGHVRALTQRMGLNAPILRLGPYACSTTLTAPTIVLPPVWTVWDSATLRGVLAHELVHIKRRDDRWLLLTRLVLLGYWWMPWLIWLYRHYLSTMEESCDDQASELIGHKLAYVGALVDAAGGSAPRRPTYAAVTEMYQHHLVGRVGRFSQSRVVEVDMRGLYWCLVTVLASVVIMTGVEPREAPRVVPFHGGVTAAHHATGPAKTPTVREQVVLVPGGGWGLAERLAFPVIEPRVIYPGRALAASLEGDVVIEFTVARDGSVVAAQVVSSTPDGVFDAAALRAVRGTRYPSFYHSDFVSTRTANEAVMNKPQANEGRAQRHLSFRLSTD